jgi:MoxR-like ATPase
MGDEEGGDLQRQIETFGRLYEAIAGQLAKVIVGHEQAAGEVLTCILAGGHALLEGVPGLGKTLLVRTLADVLDLGFSRIQFTPDLMPADITGTSIVEADEAGTKSFRFQPGPIFANLVLADEINRATPKTQSALLEAMQEHTVSVARTTHRLPEPFFVLATQNPLEMEGTYPLPEAQLDRFMLKVIVGSPDVDQLVGILDRTTGSDSPRAGTVADARGVLGMQELVRRIPAAEAVKNYVARIVRATHPEAELAPALARKYVRYGSSPRGAQAILLASKVRALRAGRSNVAFEDVRAVVAPALRHRLILSFEGQADGVVADDLLNEIVRSLPQAEGV